MTGAPVSPDVSSHHQALTAVTDAVAAAYGSDHPDRVARVVDFAERVHDELDAIAQAIISTGG